GQGADVDGGIGHGGGAGARVAGAAVVVDGDGKGITALFRVLMAAGDGSGAAEADRVGSAAVAPVDGGGVSGAHVRRVAVVDEGRHGAAESLALDGVDRHGGHV